MRTRAYRRHQKELYKNKAIRRCRDWYRDWNYNEYDWNTITKHYSETTAKFIVKYQNGHKFHDNPPKWFKQQMNRKRRAIVQDRMVHEDYENIPQFPTENCWIWD